MAGTLRNALHTQRPPVIDPVRVARPEHLLRKIMWPTNPFSFCIAKKLGKLRLEDRTCPGAPASRASSAPVGITRAPAKPSITDVLESTPQLLHPPDSPSLSLV
jgi:hypothetical protein